MLSVTVPRIASLLVAAVRGKASLTYALSRASAALLRQAGVDRFPFTCGLLILGASLPRLLISLFTRRFGRAPKWTLRQNASATATFLSSFAAALASFALLNRRPSRPEHFVTAESRPLGQKTSPSTRAANQDVLVETAERRKLSAAEVPLLAGKTLDLTLFGAVRALDIAMSIAWSQKTSRLSKRAKSFVEQAAIPTMFATSSALVMWTWFYAPQNLPPSYRSWISSAAQIDERLIQALREVRYGTFIYGQDTGRERLLGDMCRDLGMPEIWGDPAKMAIPCELYHSGTGKNCEYHALSRFVRGWSFAMRMYLPLNLAALLLRRKEPLSEAVRQAVIEAARSSSFLGLFIALFYYGVCLGRTRIGPHLMRDKDSFPTRTYIEGGPNVATGCALCGWSILLEKAARRTEISFFVAPRALASVVPRRYLYKVRSGQAP